MVVQTVSLRQLPQRRHWPATNPHVKYTEADENRKLHARLHLPSAVELLQVQDVSFARFVAPAHTLICRRPFHQLSALIRKAGALSLLGPAASTEYFP